MHVPDGIIPLWLQILLFAVSGIIIAVSLRVVNKRFDEKLIPYMGVLAAVIFAAQLVNFPVPPFTSGHLVGSTLLAVMVGPWAALIIMALVLFVQALYGDGGILTYGLNLFNMGVFSVFLGYALSLLFFKGASRAMKKSSSTLVSAAVASFIVTVSAAFILGLQLMTVPGFTTGALVAITSVHVIIGFGEAVLTSVILLYFVKAKPDLIIFLREEPSSDAFVSSDDSTVIDDGAQGVPARDESYTRPLIVTALISITIVAIALISGIASENPDGFEWALFEFAGIPEPSTGFEGIFSLFGEGLVIDMVTGSIGILVALILAVLIFRRSSLESHQHGRETGKFLLPFAEGKRFPSPFSSAGLIVSAIALAVLISIQSSILVLSLLILMILSTGVMAGTNWRRVISMAAKFEVIILFWVVLEPFLYGSTVMLILQFPWGPVYAYWEGFFFGLLLGMRMFAILLVFLATLSHMTLSEFIGALRTLRVPTSILGSLLIMFRYVPLFLEERSRMQDAQRIRGFERGTGFEKLRSLGYLVGTTIDRAFDRSSRVFESMSLRGFGKDAMVSSSGFRRSDSILPILIFSLIMTIAFLFPPILEAIIL
ncbi:MAG: energy-coupling factor ABC transporter permease [Candidatus Hodarchaeota archaeon]